MKQLLVSVIGGHECDAETGRLAKEIGKVIAEEGAVLVCGGLGGIMEAACKGAKEKNGLTIGIIPGDDKREANDFVDIPIATGLGYSRNAIVAGCADIVIALPGEYGTLSEIGHALNSKRCVYGFGAWEIAGVKKLERPDQLRKIIKEKLKPK